MEHTPPPFFKRGPAPVVRLAFFASLSIALLILDARFRYVDGLRDVLALAAYPFQKAATAPITAARRVAEFFVTQERLRSENTALRAELLDAARDAQRYRTASAELEQLRRVTEMRARFDRQTIPAEVLYTGRDPYDYKVILDKGRQQGVLAGSLVVDEDGAIGQVTRAHDLVSEVTLITDKAQAIPVQVVRNGLRAVGFGAGASGMLELRFLPANADVRNGDELVTSGIDGSYPPGVAVAKVVRVERDATQAFARVVCRPLAGVDRSRYVLVLSGAESRPPYPVTESPRRGTKAAARAGGRSGAE
ncbi:MAG: rod shape-determining protein MreC [Betaproteobacteria bacterium]|jgi:rod shape-determining protein MreC|nr:rod shape-determining protein MreC [Betaproteobacteria bacterium]